MRRKIIMSVAAMLLLAAGTGLFAQECQFQVKEDESFSQALKNFHDLVAAMVHGPAAKGDYGALKSKAGELEKLRAAVMSANLPGKLAKRCPEISARAMALSRAVDVFAARSRENAGGEAMKSALEGVHNAYRELNSSMTSLEDLLEAFHEILQPLWHGAYPDKNTGAIKADLPKLKVRAKLIAATAVGTVKEEGSRALVDAVATLDEAVAAEDDPSILEALRIVHERYEALAEG